MFTDNRRRFSSSNRFRNLFTTDVGSHASTSKLFKFLFLVLLVILPMVIIWVVLGEFNVVGLNWTVPVGGKFFINQHLFNELDGVVHGWLHSSISPLKNGPNFIVWVPLKAGSNLTATDIIAISNIIQIGLKPVFNGLIFLPMFAVLVFDVLLSLIFIFFTRLVFLDIFPNLIATWFVIFLMVLCLVMPWNKLEMTIPVTIIVLIVGWVGSFIGLNALFNWIILHTKYSNLYYMDLIKQEKENKKYVDDFEQAKLKVQQKDIDIIEVEEKDKKGKK